jgi:hypothetical protein
MLDELEISLMDGELDEYFRKIQEKNEKIN